MSFFPTQLLKLSIENFRVYKNLELDLNSRLIFLNGENGIGKTSILEAISIASLLKSFRTSTEQDIIQWDKTFYSIRIQYMNSMGNHILHAGYGKQGRCQIRSLKKNGEAIKRIIDFIGQFQTVVFSPDDIALFDTTPIARRRFVDIVLSSFDRQYLINLQQYKKIMLMKSHFLRNTDLAKIDFIYLDSLNRELALKGTFLQKKRHDFTQEFQEPFQKYVDHISAGKDKWLFTYQPSIGFMQDEEMYFQKLRDLQKRDVQYKHTSEGIHRDQFCIILDRSPHLDIKQVASQGQKRTVALSLKMAQFFYTRMKTNETPILLIDDVLNELDVNRKKQFIEFLEDIGQAIITATDSLGLEGFIREKQQNTTVKVFHIDHEFVNNRWSKADHLVKEHI